MHPRTYDRFRKKGRLNVTAGDRVYRLARLLEEAAMLHDGDIGQAVRWLESPKRPLDGKQPVEKVTNAADYEQAMNLVSALMEGVYL